MALDPAVHGALVILATWVVNWILSSIGLNLGGELVTQLATILVGYILSLLGLGFYQRLVAKNKVLGGSSYRPPFVG